MNEGFSNMSAAGDADAFVDPVDGTVDWRSLEQAAFAGHPEVQAAIAAGIDEASRPPRRFDFAIGIVSVLVELGPVWSFGVMYLGARAFRDAGTAAAVAAGIGLIFIVQQLLLWARMSSDIREIDGRRIIIAGINTCFALVTAFGMWLYAGSHPLGYAFAAVMVVAAVVALITAVRMRRIGRTIRSGDLESAMRLSSAVGRSRAAVAAMDEADRVLVNGRIDAAVQRLRMMGVIASHVAEDAMRQPLGSLGRWEIAARRDAEARSRGKDRRNRGRISR